MPKFNTTKQKFRILWEKINKNINDLTKTDNSEEVSFFPDLSKQTNNKRIIEINNTGYFASEPSSPEEANNAVQNTDDISVPSSVIKNQLLPERYGWEKEFVLNISKNFLPFVKYVPDIKSPPSHRLVAGGIYQASGFGDANDIVTIKGDGTLLFKGTPGSINDLTIPQNNILNNFSEIGLNNLNIPIDNTKKVYNATIVYTSDGEEFSISGVITGLGVTINVPGSPCEQDTDVYSGKFFKEGGIERHDNEILSLTNTEFSFTALKAPIRHILTIDIFDEEICSFANEIPINGQTISGVFNSVASYSFTILGAWRNLTTDTFIGNNKLVVITSNKIISKNIQFSGYRPYYDSDKQGILSTHNTGINDGDFAQFELSSGNLPNTDDGHTLNYTQITLERNTDFNNIEFIVDGNFEADNFLAGSETFIPVYFQQSENKFITPLTGYYFLESKANIPATNRIFPKYDDIYTQTATSYDLTTKNHTLLSSETVIYHVEVVDSSVRIRLYLQNPLYWKENKTYDI